MKNEYSHNPHIPVVLVKLRGEKQVWREHFIPPRVYTLFVFLTLNTLCWILPKPWHGKMCLLFSTGKMKGPRWGSVFVEVSSLRPTLGLSYESCVFAEVTGRQHTSVSLSEENLPLIARLIVLLPLFTNREKEVPLNGHFLSYHRLTTGFPTILRCR